MTTLADLLRDLVNEAITLGDGADIDGLVEEYVEIIKTKIIGD